ncbi:MAG TPA: response regulator [Armatimonadota bacterium]|nr:response regulator [Armatimonadota bacterium]
MNHRVLCVDDDPNMLAACRRRLRGICSVQTATGGAEAMERLVSGGPFAVMVTDHRMPGMSGIELLSRAAERVPDTVRIMLTGHADLASAMSAVNDGRVFRFLTKPCAAGQLEGAVRDALEQYRLVTSERDLRTRLEARVREQVDQIAAAQLAVIVAMSRLAESRDPGTGHHLERIGTCCRVLGERLQACSRDGYQIDGAALDVLCAASALHDIGKVGIPDRILLKPGPLAEDEWAVMRTHTTLGAETLRAVDRQHPGNALVRAGIDIAEAHHEWWNGQGYPRGLTGEAIPLFARIVAVADMYDALTSDRPYRSALEHGRAVELIVTAAGQQLDPVLVDAFEATGERLHQLGARLRDGCGAPAAAGIPGGRSGESKGSLR